MQNLEQKRWRNNAFANLITGLFIAVFNLIIPALISRELDKDAYSIWSLVVQIIAYIQIFSGGIQTAVAQKIAFFFEKKDTNQIQSTACSAFIATIVITGISFVFLSALIILYPYIYPSINAEMMKALQMSTFVVGASSCFQLIALYPAGFFMGGHANIYWTFSIVIPRLSFIFFVFLNFGRGNFDVIDYSIYFGLFTATIIPISYIFLYFKFPIARPKFVNFSKDKLIEVLKYSGAQSVWGVSMLLVGSATVTVVANYDIKKIAAYTMALSLATVLSGLLQALMSPMITAVAAAKAQNDSNRKINSLISKTTVKLILIMSFFLFAYWIFGAYAVKMWVGEQYGTEVYDISNVILISFAIRNTGLPISMCLLGLKSPADGIKFALTEGFSNIIFSIILANYFGALGVAYASIFASIIGLVLAIFYMLEKLETDYVVKKYCLESIFPALKIIFPIFFIIWFIKI